MTQGWIKLHRKMMYSNVFQNEKLLKVFIYCLMKATHVDRRQIVGKRFVELEKGQFIFGRKKASIELNMKESTVRDYIELLKQDEMIQVNSTNKYSLITVVNWELYQHEENENRQQNDSKRTAKGQQNDTNKNVKNVENVKEHIPYAEIVDYLNEKANKKFKSTTSKTRDQIKARWNEGHRLKDFKQVIDVCCQEWKGQIFSNGQKGDKYLQPSTLFNGRFDERLNWSVEKTQSTAPTKTKEQIEHEQMVKEMGLFDD